MEDLAPALVKYPPAYRAPPPTVRASIRLSVPLPSADQLDPLHLAMKLALALPATEKSPPAYRAPLATARARTLSSIPAPNADQPVPPHLPTELAVTPPAAVH